MNQTADGGRQYTYLAAAIIVAAILISASIFFATSTFTTTVTRTSTETTTLIQSTSATAPSTNLPNTTSPTKGTYDVTFQQIGACSPTFWGVPWSVTIGNVTKVQPPDTKLPLDNFSLAGTTNASLTEITFSVTNGTYHYRVSPSAGFFTPTSGTVNVTGSNVTVQIAYTGTSCVTTIGTTSTSQSSSASSTNLTTTRCETTNNSIGCVTVSGTQTMGSCNILPLGKGLYIHVITDNGQPLNHTLITIYYASPICPGITILVTAQLLWTNATGWANYDLNGAGTYRFTVQYPSQQYSFSVLENVNQTTYATVKLPSGNLSLACTG